MATNDLKSKGTAVKIYRTFALFIAMLVAGWSDTLQAQIIYVDVVKGNNKAKGSAADNKLKR